MDFDAHNDPTNPDATPLYDGLGWADYWSPADWVTWHASMKLAYSVEIANARFLDAWRKDSLFNSAPLDARIFDPVFRRYAKDNGFYDGLFSSGLGILAKPLGVIPDVADGISKASGVVGFILPALAVGLVVLWAARYAPKVSILKSVQS